jgi:hypothetical protein
MSSDDKMGKPDTGLDDGGKGAVRFDPEKVEMVSLSSLTLDPDNVRTHPERNVAALTESLRRFGQQKPVIVDKHMVVRAGNGLVTAAADLGWNEIAVYRTGLDGPEAIAFAIADNRTAELSEWDYQGLADQIRALLDDGVDVAALGWAEYELEPLLAAEWTPPTVEDDGLDTPATNGGGAVAFTAEQREIINRAIALVRELSDDPGVPEGRCLELIAGEYIGANRPVPE